MRETSEQMHERLLEVMAKSRFEARELAGAWSTLINNPTEQTFLDHLFPGAGGLKKIDGRMSALGQKR
jgi:hypothetical protein